MTMDPRTELPRPEKLDEARCIVRWFVAELRKFCDKDDLRLMVDYMRGYVQSGKINDVEAYGDGADHG